VQTKDNPNYRITIIIIRQKNLGQPAHQNRVLPCQDGPKIGKNSKTISPSIVFQQKHLPNKLCCHNGYIKKIEKIAAH
jgi:hypothetical protein